MRILVLLTAMSPLLGAGACELAGDSSRIAIAGGSITEIVYLLGAEDRIVAVDATSSFPDEAARFPSVGYVRNLSTEGLLSLSPTLILGENDMGPPEVLDQLSVTGVEIVTVPERHSAQGIADKVYCVAQVLGVDPQRVLGEARFRTDPALPDSGRRVGVVLGLQDGVPLAAGANTSGDGLLKMAGATNVFSAVDGWKPVSLEAMAAANPEFIVITERGVEAAGGMETVLAHPAVRLTTAGMRGQVIAMDGMAMLGFGPRTLDSAARLREQLAAAEP